MDVSPQFNQPQPQPIQPSQPSPTSTMSPATSSHVTKIVLVVLMVLFAIAAGVLAYFYVTAKKSCPDNPGGGGGGDCTPCTDGTNGKCDSNGTCNGTYPPNDCTKCQGSNVVCTGKECDALTSGWSGDCPGGCAHCPSGYDGDASSGTCSTDSHVFSTAIEASAACTADGWVFNCDNQQWTCCSDGSCSSSDPSTC